MYEVHAGPKRRNWWYESLQSKHFHNITPLELPLLDSKYYGYILN